MRPIEKAPTTTSEKLFRRGIAELLPRLDAPTDLGTWSLFQLSSRERYELTTELRLKHADSFDLIAKRLSSWHSKATPGDPLAARLFAMHAVELWRRSELEHFVALLEDNIAAFRADPKAFTPPSRFNQPYHSPEPIAIVASARFPIPALPRFPIHVLTLFDPGDRERLRWTGEKNPLLPPLFEKAGDESKETVDRLLALTTDPSLKMLLRYRFGSSAAIDRQVQEILHRGAEASVDGRWLAAAWLAESANGKGSDTVHLLESLNSDLPAGWQRRVDGATVAIVATGAGMPSSLDASVQPALMASAQPGSLPQSQQSALLAAGRVERGGLPGRQAEDLTAVLTEMGLSNQAGKLKQCITNNRTGQTRNLSGQGELALRHRLQRQLRGQSEEAFDAADLLADDCYHQSHAELLFCPAENFVQQAQRHLEQFGSSSLPGEIKLPRKWFRPCKKINRNPANAAKTVLHLWQLAKKAEANGDPIPQATTASGYIHTFWRDVLYPRQDPGVGVVAYLIDVLSDENFGREFVVDFYDLRAAETSFQKVIEARTKSEGSFSAALESTFRELAELLTEIATEVEGTIDPVKLLADGNSTKARRAMWLACGHIAGSVSAGDLQPFGSYLSAISKGSQKDNARWWIHYESFQAFQKALPDALPNDPDGMLRQLIPILEGYLEAPDLYNKWDNSLSIGLLQIARAPGSAKRHSSKAGGKNCRTANARPCSPTAKPDADSVSVCRHFSIEKRSPGNTRFPSKSDSR